MDKPARGLSVVVVVTTLFAGSLRASAEEPSCETVTTVRCTGSTAPLALPGAQLPAPAPAAAPVVIPAPPIVVPAPVPAPLPPQADDAEIPRGYAPPPPDCCADPRVMPLAEPRLALLPGGWRVMRSGGEIYLERKKKTGVAGVWAPGLALWLVSYVGTSAGGVTNDRPWAAAPFLGGFIAGGIDMADGKMGSGVGYTVGSVMQLSGFVMFLVGLSVGEKIERMPVAIAPVGYRDGGGGVSLQGRF